MTKLINAQVQKELMIKLQQNKAQQNRAHILLDMLSVFSIPVWYDGSKTYRHTSLDLDKYLDMSNYHSHQEP